MFFINLKFSVKAFPKTRFFTQNSKHFVLGGGGASSSKMAPAASSAAAAASSKTKGNSFQTINTDLNTF